MPYPSRFPPTRRTLLQNLGRAGLAAGLLPLATRRAAATTAVVSHQLGWVKDCQFGGDFMAAELGLFAREGLDVRFTAGGPGTDYRSLVSAGRDMVSESNIAGLLDGASQGQPLVAFAAVMQRDPGCFLSLPKNPIASLAGMQGKTIGLPNNIRGQVTALLRHAGIDPRRVRLVPVGTDPGLLVSGGVDAYWGYATTAVPALRHAGIDPYVLPVSDIGISDYGQVLFTRRDVLATQRDVLIRYTRALIGGWTYMVAHPDETAKIVVAKYAQPGTDFAQQVAEARMMVGYVDAGDAKTHGLLWIDPDRFRKGLVLHQAVNDDEASTPIDLNALVTQDIVRAAHGKA